MTRNLPQCRPGFYLSDTPPPDQTSDRGWCYPCSPGTYMDERSRERQCKACRICSRATGKMVEDSPCGTTVDARCRCHDDYEMVNGTCLQRPTAAAISVLSTTASTIAISFVRLVPTTNTEPLTIPTISTSSESHSTASSPAEDFSPKSVALTEPLGEGLDNVGRLPLMLILVSVVTASVTAAVLVTIYGHFTFAATVNMIDWIARRRRKARKPLSAVLREVEAVAPEEDDHFYEDPDVGMARFDQLPRHLRPPDQPLLSADSAAAAAEGTLGPDYEVTTTFGRHNDGNSQSSSVLVCDRAVQGAATWSCVPDYCHQLLATASPLRQGTYIYSC